MSHTVPDKIRVRPETWQKITSFAQRRRLSKPDVADIAVTALESLTKAQVDALVERRPLGEARGRRQRKSNAA